MTVTSILDAVASVVTDVVAPSAASIDKEARFPRDAVAALGKAGALGLVSANDVGGAGGGPRAAANVVEALARECASTAMVVCMHYAATAVIEAHGPPPIREAIAAGRHLSTLALSEFGSRGHFWAPVSTAVADDGVVRLTARKSMSTSAGQADSYVWSSRPVAASGASTLWLVPAGSDGLTIGPVFDGLGLRGNASTSLTGDGITLTDAARLGADGAGFDIMMGAILPIFQVMSTAMSLGTMEAATTKAAAHAAGTRFEHMGSSLAELPTVRAYLARMRIATDQTRALLGDTIDALETGRADAMLRVLECKAAAGEAALQVTELAMRVCGGAAFRKDIGIERHFRDARAASVMAPTTDVLYDFIGRITAGLPLFDEPAQA